MTFITTVEQKLAFAKHFFDGFTPRIQSYAFWNGVQVDVLREDESHTWISGNKFRKLKYNVLYAIENQKSPWVTFGGAHSNHLAAFSYACQYFGVQGIVYVRGEELSDSSLWDKTLRFAHACGVTLRFISRKGYQNKEAIETDVLNEYPNAWIIPEGGSNALGVKGCEELYRDKMATYDWVACAVGTGGTFSGVMKAVKPHQTAIGVTVLKADLWKDIRTFAPTEKGVLLDAYHFGGYAKMTPELVDFMNKQYAETLLFLDPIYTGKLVFALHQEIKKGSISGKKGLFIHTGGLQGIFAMNQQLKLKGLPALPEPSITF